MNQKKKICGSVWTRKNSRWTKSTSTPRLSYYEYFNYSYFIVLSLVSCSHHLNYKRRNLIRVHKHIRFGCIKKSYVKEVTPMLSFFSVYTPNSFVWARLSGVWWCNQVCSFFSLIILIFSLTNLLSFNVIDNNIQKSIK